MYQYNLAPVKQAFDDYMNTDIPNTTGTFKQCEDFSLYRNDWDEYPDLRCMTSVINWKSSIGGSDSTRNFRVSLDTPIHRGDLIYDPMSNSVGMLTWHIENMPDCHRSQISTCNAYMSVKRNVPEKLDEMTGMVIQEASTKLVVDHMPICYGGMYGRYNYEVSNNTPGIMPDQKIEIRVQWNPETMDIKNGDFVIVRNVEHRVMFITWDYLDADDAHGYIVLTCERVE